MARGRGKNGGNGKPVARAKRRPIEHYEHSDKKRVNNPPVGLVTPETDPPLPTHKVYDYVDPVPTVKPGKNLDYDPHLDPQLVWAGKKEHASFEVPTVSLHVHETIDPSTIIEAVRRRNGSNSSAGVSPAGFGLSSVAGVKPAFQPSLFERPEEKLPLRDAVDFYKHPHGWSNRLIAGDSLLVMNSLLEKEGMAGKVQMVYIDPPYGIKYGSNFQPFVNKRDVKDGKDEDLTQEPEMIRAFRDTWELGIHSYLTYLRDRLLLARELLHESGSVFVQISDDNVHHIRELMDDVFGSERLVVTIPVKKKGSQKSSFIDPVNDYILWYGKRSRSEGGPKFRAIFERREIDAETVGEFRHVELSDEQTGVISQLQTPGGESYDYRLSPKRLFVDHPAARLFRPWPITNGGVRPNQMDTIEFDRRKFDPPKGRCWSYRSRSDQGISGMERLKLAGRLFASGDSLDGKRYLDDFNYKSISNWWDGLGGASEPIYVVQTNPEIIQRCIQMTTDPGDLVFDPTCGSGTTAAVAEQWGRRWITCDTSRVAITLAKQRLMTADFDFYELAHPEEGVGSGFRYKTVPHVTLKSIANNPEIREGMSRVQIDAAIARYADQETLYDQPYTDKSRARVTGPFTVEAVPAPTVRSLEDFSSTAFSSAGVSPASFAFDSPGSATSAQQSLSDFRHAPTPLLDASVARKGPTLRHSEWRDELLKTGLRGKGGQHIDFSRVEPLAGTRWLHADAETKGAKPERVVVSFGPEYSLLEQRQVELAWEEARSLSPKPAILVFAAFEFDPEAAKDIDGMTKEKTGMTFLTAQMNADLLTADLKKKRASNQGFWLVGRPDVDLRSAVSSAGVSPATLGSGTRPKSLWQVEVRGFDYYDTRTGSIESGDVSKIAMWLLDTDYDGRSLYPRQVFFPMAGEDEGWTKLTKSLKAEIDPDLIEKYRGTVSLPFEIGANKRIAVKVIDDRGIESLKVVDAK